MEGFLDILQNSGAVQFIIGQNIWLLFPELSVLLALIFATCQSFSSHEKERRDTWWIAMLGVVFALICLMLLFPIVHNPAIGASFFSVFSGFGEARPDHGLFQADLFSWIIRTVLVLGTAVVLLLSRQYVDEKTQVPGEFYVLLLGGLLGGMFMSGATDLIMLFVGLETLGISSYILAGYLRSDFKSGEASLKYLLYGGVSTAILLFGLSLLYGFTGGHTHYLDIAQAVQQYMGHVQASQGQLFAPIVPIMLVMILGAFAFKLSAAPFHMWTPDVYEGAPTPVTAYLSVVSKIAGFSLAIRFLYSVIGPLPGWSAVLIGMALLSMVIGNVVAVVQRHNIKRLLAYSTVAHAGYILLGLVVMTTDGLSSMVYYLFTYLFMNLGAFAAITHLGRLLGTDETSAYAGLVQKRPFLAFALSIFLLSLAGIPITAGFFAKFFLFQAVAVAGTQYLWLVVVALLTSTISLYYYLNVIRLMVVVEPSPEVKALPSEHGGRLLPSPIALALGICLVGTIVLGFLATPCLELSQKSVAMMKQLPSYVSQVPTVSAK